MEKMGIAIRFMCVVRPIWFRMHKESIARDPCLDVLLTVRTLCVVPIFRFIHDEIIEVSCPLTIDQPTK